MMSSLVPGTIFGSSGFNRKSTPTPPNISPAELDNRYKRVDFNGDDWPADSPVARSYDVSNTSTKMIILNNRHGKSGTRLRGYYTGPKKPDRYVDPDRHRMKSPRNLDWHMECYNSSSPKFEPAVKTELEWLNTSQRPPNALIASSSYGSQSTLSSLTDKLSIEISSIGDSIRESRYMVSRSSVGSPRHHPPLNQAKGAVNPQRHATCRISTEMRAMSSRPTSRMMVPPSKYFNNSEYADMTIGERVYLYSIERIYSMEKMKQLKQEQYKKLLDQEAKKGYHGSDEYTKYMRYINSAKDRSHGTGTPSDKRARSAVSYRSRSATSRASTHKSDKTEDSKTETQQERPKTSVGHSEDREKGKEKPSRATSAASADRKSVSSQQHQQKNQSPSPSRKSSAKGSAYSNSPYGAPSGRSQSQRSLRSKASSRASSAASAKHAGKQSDKGDHSYQPDKGDQSDRDEHPTHHKEGVDRPKSRLGHPHPDDKDKGPVQSSSVSIKSSSTLTSDSGVENDHKGKKTSKPKEEESTSKKDKMGSKVSVGSRASKKSDEAQTDGDNTKVHRVPSAGYMEGNRRTGVAKTEDKKDFNDEDTKHADSDDTLKDDNDTPKDTTNDTKPSSSEETDTDETNDSEKDKDSVKELKPIQDTNKMADSVRSTEGIDEGSSKKRNTSEPTNENNGLEEVDTNLTDDAKTDGENEPSRNKLNRQKSVDENDTSDDERGWKDPNKIEY